VLTPVDVVAVPDTFVETEVVEVPLTPVIEPEIVELLLSPVLLEMSVLDEFADEVVANEVLVPSELVSEMDVPVRVPARPPHAASAAPTMRNSAFRLVERRMTQTLARDEMNIRLERSLQGLRPRFESRRDAKGKPAMIRVSARMEEATMRRMGPRTAAGSSSRGELDRR
jgi:hypothetical protein